MIITAIKIDEYDGYIIHGYPRAGTGSHTNDYVKIKKGNLLGKFLFLDDSWEKGCSFEKSTKNKLEQYLLKNKQELRQKIKDLG